ncbi:MAG: HAD hydrolase-like protein [Armatimonadetes bacterium]|nr:HAD hydrolase-like protein [Armatimonadota bacterium]MDW8122065.1 HAD hydrolase-like protein [Armatimonadota bacterium]
MPVTLDILSRKIVLNPDAPFGRMTHALFDFDGTLSLLRSGWQSVMVQMMVEILAELNSGETEEELRRFVRDYVDRLTGKQTIYQMIRLAEEVAKRGGTPKDVLEYKRIYHQRLWQVIQDRVEGVKSGRIAPDEKLTPGARPFLTLLKEQGVRLYLASGTDQPFVEEEARALQIDHFFDGGIYGARDRWQEFDKDILIKNILTEAHLEGPELVAFGDGFVEIEETKKAGGVAIGVAVNEFAVGQWDHWKVRRLTQAGADLLIPDFSEYEALIQILLPK